MTLAGLNVRGNIWRIDTTTDDVVGGAVTTGTLVYTNVWLRFEAQEPEQLLLQQGLETPKIFNVTCVPATLDIRERDEVEISKPTDHLFYGYRFRVIGVRYSSHVPRDPRNYLMLTLRRSERAHTIQ